MPGQSVLNIIGFASKGAATYILRHEKADVMENAPEAGLEPATYGLTVHRSTA